MPKQFNQRSLKLTAEEWATLERLAAETNSTPPTGTTAGRPSWRTLIKRIANQKLTIAKEPNS